MTSPNSTMTVTPVLPSGVNYVAALSAGVKWGDSGAGATVGYSFPYAHGPAAWAVDYGSSQNEPDTASGFGSTHQAAARQALQQWADVADLDLVESAESATNVGDIRFAYTQTPAISPWWGWSSYPNSYWPAGGDVWVNALRAADDWSVGTSQFAALMHEIGHALGLKHPFDGAPVLPAAENSEQYTLMSYTDHPHALFRDVVDHGGGSYSWTYYAVTPRTPMLYDVAAIQYLYGANTTYHSGDNTYTFAVDSPFFMTIWDAGGSDTLSVSNFTKPCTLDLRAGHFSDITIESDPLPLGASGVTPTYDGTDNLAIAFGVIIENAVGGSGDDFLIGNGASNRLDGGSGNDTLVGGLGADSLYGGAGTDTLDYSEMTGAVSAELWRGTVTNDGAGSVDSFSGSENLIGGDNADLLSGDFQANCLQGGPGNDRIFGQEGTDTLVGGLGADSLYGGSGGDTLDYSAMVGTVTAELWRGIVTDDGSGSLDTFTGIESLIGGSNADLLSGDFQPNRVDGGAGNDRLFGQEGDDTLVGGPGADSLYGGTGSDTLDYNAMTGVVTAELWRGTTTSDGSGAVDTFTGIENLRGGSNADLLSGDTQANRLDGGAGIDRIYGQEGNDTLVGGLGADNLQGGAGSDTLDYSAMSGAVTAELWRGTITNDGSGAVDTFTGIENLSGSSNADLLSGDVQANRLEGGAGNDRIFGQEGSDVLVGGPGADSIYGGAGDDTFDFDALLESVVGSGRDVIADFTAAQSDKIDLSTIDADALLAGEQTFSFIGGAAFANVAGQLRFSGGVLSGDVNADGLADFEIQLLGLASLSNGDLLL